VIRYWAGTIGLLCLLLAVSGCANFWDEMLSHERDWSYMTGIKKPNPLTVIRDNDFKMANSDGSRRAQALSELREPLQHGGNAKDQEAYLNILIESGKQDTDPICRLCAIRALGKFHDPRAARALEDIHKQQNLPFTPDNNHMIRKEALVALEMTKDPEAWKFLVVVARAPAPTPTADLVDRQQTQDEKIVAIRALGKYRQQECTDALQAVLRSEKDVALRGRALQSLEESTGKRWPGDYAAWQKNEVQPLPGDPNGDFIQRVSGWVPRLPF
jgi:PBS lyase HEAT-like repeat